MWPPQRCHVLGGAIVGLYPIHPREQVFERGEVVWVGYYPIKPYIPVSRGHGWKRRASRVRVTGALSVSRAVYYWRLGALLEAKTVSCYIPSNSLFCFSGDQNLNSENSRFENQSPMDSVMESGDWRALFQRQRIVNKIMDILKRHLPFSGHEEQQQLNKIAERVEHEIYTAATTQSEYSRMICFMMLTMETRLQNPMRSNSASVNLSVPFDSTAQAGNPNGGDWQEEVYQKIKAMKDLYLQNLKAQTGNPNGEDWQEEVYQKIKAMKDLYLLDLNDMHQKILSKLQQYDSLPQQPQNQQIEKLKVFKNMLERFMLFLHIPKHEILSIYKDKLGTYEKQIINVINSRKRKPQQQAQA